MLSRPQIQPYAQYLMGAGTLAVTATVAALDAPAIGVPYLIGLAVIAANCVAMALLWKFKPTSGIVWVSVVPIADILACVPIRAAAVEVLPAAGLLVLFPITWLAFAFPVAPTVVGVLSTLLLQGAALVFAGTPPVSLGEWLWLFTPTVLLALIALAARVVASDLRTQRSRADSASRRLAEALQSSTRNAATLRQLLDTTPDAVAVFDADGDVLLVNAPAAEMARRGRIPIGLSRSDDALIFRDDRATPLVVGDSFAADIMAGRYAHPRRAWLGDGDEQIAVRFVARQIVDSDDTIGTLVVAHDITELIEAVDVRDRFLDTVGHELRTPLTVIIAHADLALLDEHGAERERWEAVQRSADRLDHTVERMLATGRVDVAQRSGEAETREVVFEAVRSLGDVARGVPVEVVGHAGRARIGTRELATIVVELVRNAVQASSDGAGVLVRLGVVDASVEITVIDEGPGLSPEERRQAFDRFYRTPRSRRSAVQGLGLGLSLAKALAEAHGGELRLDEGPRGGTSAVLRLPAV